MKVREPTGDECSLNAQVYRDERSIGYAVWYPQMGGYCGKAVALMDREWTEDEDMGVRMGGCIEVLVWHNGKFPFHVGENPAVLHHCDAEQFVSFGQLLLNLNSVGRRQ